MKTTFLPVVFIVSIFLFSLNLCQSQVFNGPDASSKIPGTSLVKINESLQTVEFVKLEAFTIVREEEHLPWLLNQVLKAEPGISLKLIRSESDQIGYIHYRYAEFYKTIPVEYGVYYVHIRQGIVQSANGEYYNKIRISTVPALSKDEAFKIALKDVHSEKYNDEDGGLGEMKNNGSLIVLPVDQGYKLAYKFDIYSLEPLKRLYIYIDAKTGAKIKEINRIETIDAKATTLTAYNGTVTMTTDSTSPTNFRLRASKGFGGIITKNLNNGSQYGLSTDFTDSNNTWNLTGLDHYALDVHFGTEATYDWYLSRFGRNSYDNQGAVLKNFVHYTNNYVNAFWDGKRMTYGDGDGVNFMPLTSLDIVAHEITHAVTQKTANLVYSGESGGLNESFSDCFGVTIDYYKNPTTANFLIADQVNNQGIPFRNMGNPKQYFSPDCYKSTYWQLHTDVHEWSGVQNFWYYLLCMGGSGVNDLGNSYTVDSIGFIDASAIAYRSLSVYLTNNSNYPDARFYAIQSAIDLFGICSTQKIQVTNAWHAVGVGGYDTNTVSAGFKPLLKNFCVVPATINFINYSFNATSYYWNFGDGDTSTLINPVHTYLSAGNFTVTLIATGVPGCVNSDTLSYNNLINITNGGGPISPFCIPLNNTYCCSIGIANVTFGSINNSSGDASEGYVDFTCSVSTTITAGDPVALSITTGHSYEENIKAWIDYDNDGVFNNNELVFSSWNNLILHQGIVHTPVSAVLNSALRLRVIDEQFTLSVVGPCYHSQRGQAEDYAVTFIANTLSPITDFTSDKIIVNPGDSVAFTDLTVHAPTSWQWNFPGAIPSYSASQNPVVVYNIPGIYPVTLTAVNAFGADTIIKTGYIQVATNVNMCTGITFITSPAGLIFDSGGPNGNYRANENCSLLIAPDCAQSITLSFSHFHTEIYYDSLRVYDGTNVSAPLLLGASGWALPSDVTANSGKMYITWKSNSSYIDSGFVAQWSTVAAPGNPPIASFTMDTIAPFNVQVQFNDSSGNVPNAWSWNFGDGHSSVLQNPLHAFSLPGVYLVTLIVLNCTSSDTISQTITIEPPPVISITPDTVFISLNCNDSITLPVSIYNTGAGDLVVSQHNLALDTAEVLTFMVGVDQHYLYPGIISAINVFNNKCHITKLYSSDPADLIIALQNKDVLLFPQETNWLKDYTMYAPIVQSFVNSGKFVVFGGQWTIKGLYDFGLFTGAYSGNLINGVPLPVLDTADGLMEQVPSHVISEKETYKQIITNSDKISLIKWGNDDIVTYRNVGFGKAIYIGFNYRNWNTAAARILGNAIKGFDLNDQWFRLSGTDTISPGDSASMYITINDSDLLAGNYHVQITLQSNDPNNPVLHIPLYLTVNGPPELALSDSCLYYGTITTSTSKTDTFSISNNGCDTLHITSILSSDSAFVANPAVFDILPHTEQKIAVTFHPLFQGTYNAILSILNNDHDTSICLAGSAGPAPLALINPSFLNIFLTDCQDSITIPVFVHNYGGSDLIYNINSSVFSAVNILALNYGADMVKGYPNTINGINTYFKNYTLTASQTTFDTVVRDLLPGIDVILFPSKYFGTTTYYSSLTTIVQSFLAAGGTVIYCGSSGTGNLSGLYDLGLFSGSFRPMYFANYSCIVMNNSLNLVDSVPPIFVNSYYLVGQNITNSDKVSVVDADTSDIVTYRTIGAGKATYIGFDYYESNTYTQRIISNAVRYAHNNILPYWMKSSSLNGTIFPGDSTLIYLTFYTGGLSSGTYTTTLVFNSNDSLNPHDSLPITFTVTNFNTSFSISGNGQIGQPLQFTSVAPGAISYLWSFGNGDSSTNASPQYIYGAPGTYFVSLIVSNGLCTDTLYDTLTISLTGIYEANEEVEFSVSPNPFNHELKLGYTLKAEHQTSIKVMDVTGRLVRQFELESLQKPGKYNYVFQSPTTGIYFIHFSLDGKDTVYKVAKMK